MIGARTLNRVLRSVGYEIRRVEAKKAPVLRADYWCIRRLVYFKKLLDLVGPVDGDVVECGIGRGETFFLLAALTMLSGGKNRNIWGFDSFDGFPAPSQEDASPRSPKAGDWKDVTIKEDDVLQMLCAGGLPDEFIQERVKLVKGFFDKSLVDFTGDHVAFLHLDVDLYQSYKQTLEYFWPKVSTGGVVLFDEYKQPGVEDAFPGAAKAIDEFFGARARLIQYEPSVRRYYIVKED